MIIHNYFNKVHFSLNQFFDYYLIKLGLSTFATFVLRETEESRKIYLKFNKFAKYFQK